MERNEHVESFVLSGFENGMAIFIGIGERIGKYEDGEEALVRRVVSEYVHCIQRSCGWNS